MVPSDVLGHGLRETPRCLVFGARVGSGEGSIVDTHDMNQLSTKPISGRGLDHEDQFTVFLHTALPPAPQKNGDSSYKQT